MSPPSSWSKQEINDTVQGYREVAFQDCVTLLVRRIRTRIIA
jgi:hypothetical protein